MGLRRLFQRKQRADHPGPEWTREQVTVPADQRRYLEGSEYQLPKDFEEDQRLDLQHHALFHALGNHYLAPISKNVRTILDVGTGTGIWAGEMARLFPNALVAGLDLSAASFRPPALENCYLGEGNVLTGLPFPAGFFSYTHQRLLSAGITALKWPGVVRELVRVTRPGGWLEMVEIDNQLKDAGPATAKAGAFLDEVVTSLGFDWNQIRHLGDLLSAEGLQEVEMQTIPIPLGDWAGRIGQMMKIDLLAATNAMRGRYCAQAGISGSEFDQMIKAMGDEWEKYHPSCLFYAAYGKKGAQTQ